MLQQATPGSGTMAYEMLREAKVWYERAEALRPAGNDDVLLRWNACARLLMENPDLAREPEEHFRTWLE